MSTEASTRAPALAKARAVALPIPVEAPVTTTTCSINCRGTLLSPIAKIVAS